MHSQKPLALVIEDDQSAGEALAMVLEDWGADVMLITGPADARSDEDARLRQARWIITDCQAGAARDGITLAGQFAADAPSARVLVLTGSVKKSSEQDARAAGFEVMSKPAPVEAILAWLEHT